MRKANEWEMSRNCISNTKDLVILERTQNWALNNSILVLIFMLISYHLTPLLCVCEVLGEEPRVSRMLRQALGHFDTHGPT